jgi:3-(3-hydroxy-phenyl)propionate hydroxylase
MVRNRTPAFGYRGMNTQQSETEILIIGAGPVGLTLANELARRGVKPIVIDKASGIREVSKALILHVRTQEALACVGIADSLSAEARPLTEVVVHAYGKHVGSWNLDGIDSPHPHPLILGQNRTQHLLLDLLAERGVSVAWDSEALSLTTDASGAHLRLRRPDGTEADLHARYIVGCEGSNSLVRKSLGLTFEGERYSGEQFIQADCKINWALPAGRSYLFLTADGYLMVIEMPGDRVRVFISLPDDNQAGAAEAAKQLGAVEATTDQPTLNEIATELTRLTGFECDLSEPVWLARYRTSHRYADTFQNGPAFIAGDAGHVHVPIGGQGMNTGIQDAFNLGWKLAGVLRGELRAEVLESYSAERHPVAAGLIRGTDFAYRGILHPSDLRQRATRMIGPFVIRSERAQGFMRSTLEELSVAYPTSPLNLDLRGARGPAPGERVLDATLVRAGNNRTVTLAALTGATTAWTLLLFAGDERHEAGELVRVADAAQARFGTRIAPWIVLPTRSASPDAGPPERILLDPLRLMHERYDVSGPTIYVLRPDTYVAARGPLTASARLIEHLATIFT